MGQAQMATSINCGVPPFMYMQQSQCAQSQCPWPQNVCRTIYTTWQESTILLFFLHHVSRLRYAHTFWDQKKKKNCLREEACYALNRTHCRQWCTKFCLPVERCMMNKRVQAPTIAYWNMSNLLIHSKPRWPSVTSIQILVKYVKAMARGNYGSFIALERKSTGISDTSAALCG